MDVLRFFFFFQAEDGIRDHCVTGVQTCALPIWPGAATVSEGTGRTTVWGEVARFLEKPNLDHIFGYGQNGQVVTGVSVGYVALFPGEEDINPLAHSAHNLVLQ